MQAKGGQMPTSNINIRVDETLRSQAAEVFSSYGLSTAQAIKLFLNQVVNTQKVPISFDYNHRTPNAETLQAMAEAKSDNVITYNSLDGFIKAHE